ncbi:MAG: ferrous iron transport protein A [Bifidobacteriaceae bacterium]|jgi:Fe2+ transport system protein FeoA|nr:ferrous iron transport protein A [Bifidobacteriaceae bacterium]
MKLKDCEIGQKIIVDNIELNEDFCFRLREIGITEGVNLKVCQKCSFGSLVIQKGAERIGIDSKIADGIQGVAVNKTDKSTSLDSEIADKIESDEL